MPSLSRIKRLLPKPVRKRGAEARDYVLRKWVGKSLSRRLARPASRQPHDLGGELIVSLTSYPARFPTLHLTIACLLDQTVRADRTILWVAHDDISRLSPEVRELEQRGLEIRGCEDFRSFKKLIPAVEAFPTAFIATADDDLYYRRNWLETLVNGAEDGVIACHRAHRIKRLATGQIAPYAEWEIDVQDARARQPSMDILATSGAGALYPPGSLGPFVTDRTKFERLCPDGDDLWFHWCAGLAGTRRKKVGTRMRLVTWPRSQDLSLWQTNEHGGNDAAVAALQAEFGYPG